VTAEASRESAVMEATAAREQMAQRASLQRLRARPVGLEVPVGAGATEEMAGTRRHPVYWDLSHPKVRGPEAMAAPGERAAPAVPAERVLRVVPPVMAETEAGAAAEAMPPTATPTAPGAAAEMAARADWAG
jgi:hypothetical protein